MSHGPESRVTTRILRTLNAMRRIRAVKNHGSRYAEVGRPDIFACADGRFVALEVKSDMGRVTPAQNVQLCLWRDAGAMIAVVRTIEEAVLTVEDAMRWNVE